MVIYVAFLLLNKMNSFDIERLTAFVLYEIKKFAEKHQKELFYGFAIDGNLLCVNSIEQFEKSLNEYRKKWGGYDTEEEIINLKLNTGDWHYQAFAEFDEKCGFNMDSYEDHYNADKTEQSNSAYSKAMDEVIERLKASEAFKSLPTTGDFFINRLEHNY